MIRRVLFLWLFLLAASIIASGENTPDKPKLSPSCILKTPIQLGTKELRFHKRKFRLEEVQFDKVPVHFKEGLTGDDAKLHIELYDNDSIPKADIFQGERLLFSMSDHYLNHQVNWGSDAQSDRRVAHAFARVSKKDADWKEIPTFGVEVYIEDQALVGLVITEAEILPPDLSTPKPSIIPNYVGHVSTKVLKGTNRKYCLVSAKIINPVEKRGKVPVEVPVEKVSKDPLYLFFTNAFTGDEKTDSKVAKFPGDVFSSWRNEFIAKGSDTGWDAIGETYEPIELESLLPIGERWKVNQKIYLSTAEESDLVDLEKIVLSWPSNGSDVLPDVDLWFQTKLDLISLFSEYEKSSTLKLGKRSVVVMSANKVKLASKLKYLLPPIGKERKKLDSQCKAETPFVPTKRDTFSFKYDKGEWLFLAFHNLKEDEIGRPNRFYLFKKEGKNWKLRGMIPCYVRSLLPDFNGDGHPEVMAHTSNEFHVWSIEPELKLLFSQPTHSDPDED